MSSLTKLWSAGTRLAALTLRRQRCTSADVIQYSAEVLQARAEGMPLVALESTIITHGMPYPHNLETAMQVEHIIREQGATPATIAILSGKLHVGLSSEQLSYLSQARGVVKASRRDLAPVLAAAADGATTVAGTIVAAELAGIPVFVTGGIGGVHRQGEHTLDVSADLAELGRSRTLVVCSGVKSILDIARTLEYLETQGVCVCAFGESYDFPAFYTPRSGHRAPHRVRTASEAARVARAARDLQLASGIVVAVPIPDQYAMDEAVINSAIERALDEAKSNGITGKEVTPFILAAVAKATDGASLAANIALIKNNAKVGADIAVEFSKLRNVGNSKNASNTGVWQRSGSEGPKCSRGIHTSASARAPLGEAQGWALSAATAPVLVIGGANVDRTYRLTEPHVKLDGSTHACLGDVCAGGVARNMAEALWRMRGPGAVRLLTAVGDDADGTFLETVAEGLLLDGCRMEGGRTPSYAAVMDSRGECVLGLGDMALHDSISTDLVDKHMEVLERAPLVVMDGNAPAATVHHVLALCQRMNKPVFFEPTDRRKSTVVLNNQFIKYASPNLNELRAMAAYLNPNISIKQNNGDVICEVISLSEIVSTFIEYLIITLGSKGVMIVQNETFLKRNQECNFKARLYSVQKKLHNVVNVSGAGDCFSSGFIHGTLLGLSEDQCVSIAFQAATAALLTKNTVPRDFKKLNYKSKATYTNIV